MEKEQNIQHVRAYKLEMTQLFTPEGVCIPVTAVKVVEGELHAGDVVSVRAVSKGKGFAGAVKRYSFGGGPKTHGQSDRHRAVGSIGQGTFPGRVWKGKKMPGRMGSDKHTVIARFLGIDKSLCMIKVKGCVPGSRNSEVLIYVPVKSDGEN